MRQVLTEKDLELLFSTKNKTAKKRRTKRNILYFLSPFAFMLVLFVALNYQSIGENLYYWFQFDYLVPVTNTNNNTLNTSPAEKKTEAENSQYPMPSLPEISNNTLNIPSIGITAPVTWQVENKPDNITAALKNGVGQIYGTSLPGETGNVFITGHSSNYPWIKSQYNSIFAIINKMVAGDIVQIKYSDQIYAYKVSEIKVVDPDETSVMLPTPEPVLTLMTCTPVGTSLRRLIIISKQIYPDPAKNTKSKTEATTQSMPKKVH